MSTQRVDNLGVIARGGNEYVFIPPVMPEAAPTVSTFYFWLNPLEQKRLLLNKENMNSDTIVNLCDEDLGINHPFTPLIIIRGSRFGC